MIDEKTIDRAIYCDGGCAGHNPSSIGGSWAWCSIFDDKLIFCKSGVIEVTEFSLLQKVTNNQMEFYAMLHALEILPDGWSGRVCSDSGVTIGRFFKGRRCEGIPAQWQRIAAKNLARLGELVPVLHQGHPRKADLEFGIGAKRHLPVSKWNVFCDELRRAENHRLLDRVKSN